MASTGPAADAARAAFQERIEAKGHAVANAREAAAGLEAAFAAGALVRTPALELMLGDLDRAHETDDPAKVGKSPGGASSSGDLPRARERLTRRRTARIAARA
jgi:hypothetical protein